MKMSYRVFISYSHDDEDELKLLVTTLKKNGLTPLFDKGFAGGTGFHEQIKTFIAHAHVFLPLISKTSARRGWVRQEIGYATALNIPVLPVTIGPSPPGIIQLIQAVRMDEDSTDLAAKLARSVFDRLVKQDGLERPPHFQCARDNRERAVLLAEYANAIRHMGHYGVVRQKGALTSFHIPNRRPDHPDWARRYGGNTRDEYYCRCLRAERVALELHARRMGCRLIIDPTLSYKEYGADAKAARLMELLAFLLAQPDKSCRVAVKERSNAQESTTLVGDWFWAQAVSAKIGKGYRQTIFTRHAPSVRMYVEEFDEEFAECLAQMGCSSLQSRRFVIDLLRKEISTCAPAGWEKEFAGGAVHRTGRTPQPPRTKTGPRRR